MFCRNFGLAVRLAARPADKPRELIDLLRPGIVHAQSAVEGVVPRPRYNGEREKAEKASLRAIELNPLGPHARVDLGILYLKDFKDRKKAEEQFQFVIEKIDPNNKPANFCLKAMKEGRF